MPRKAHGLSLMIVLIALVVLSLAAVGLVRMVDTSALVVGNLAFKQSTTSAADGSAEAAIGWLGANNAGQTLFENNAGAGYYASSLTALDVTGKSADAGRALVDWNDDDCAYAASGSFATCFKPAEEESENGYTTSYLITRMCKATGDPNASTNVCARPPSASAAGAIKRGEVKYGEGRLTGSAGQYFRVVVRSEGPRNTVSYTETYVHF